MKSIIYKGIFCFLLPLTVLGHDPAIATFHISKDGTQWYVRAEYSWALRNAIIQNYPFLEEKGTDESQFTDCVKEYLENHINIVVHGIELQTNRIIQIPGEYSHSYVYMMEFCGPAEASEFIVENLSLYGLYKKQKNIIYLEFQDLDQKCISSKGKPKCEFTLN